MTARQIQLGDISIANDRPFTLLGGVNVLEISTSHCVAPPTTKTSAEG